jgi:hypothetical protein
LPIRFASAALAVAVILAAPSIVAAAVTGVPTPAPILRPAGTDIKVPVPTPTPTAPPSGPTIVMDTARDGKITLGNIHESAASGPTPKDCLVFTVSAPLNAADGVTLLRVYSTNEFINPVIITDGPVVYKLRNAQIKSYQVSGPTVTMVFIRLRPAAASRPSTVEPGETLADRSRRLRRNDAGNRSSRPHRKSATKRPGRTMAKRRIARAPAHGIYRYLSISCADVGIAHERYRRVQAPRATARRFRR